jgi:sensor c-di-GMP phosphodiesterase-like protein
MHRVLIALPIGVLVGLAITLLWRWAMQSGRLPL